MSAAGHALGPTRRALMMGNFVIGCGVMVVAGTLNDMAASLQVSVAVAGQLIAIAAVVMGVGAPLLAVWVSGWDRRRLLVVALVWYGLGHALSALMPDYGALWPVRALTMLAAAVFTPQAAAAIVHMAAPAERGRSITTVFLGWALASVLGMPLNAWVGETYGWRVAMAGIAFLALAMALVVHRSMPADIQPPGLSLRAWRGVITNPVLMAMVGVTALAGAGQFTVFSYFAPYFRDVMQASPAQLALVFGWFGLFGLAGNLTLSRQVDRIGAHRAVAWLLALILVSLALWPLARSVGAMLLVLVPWGLGCMASNSAQQARLGHVAPLLAPALMALNTSAIYLGQAVGAAGGGWLVSHGGYAQLHWVALLLVGAALALSLWAARACARGAVLPAPH
jgi:predicted MFS family arabinose efflux permease